MANNGYNRRYLKLEYLFGAFALESYVPGWPRLSVILLTYAWLLMASNMLFIYYMLIEREIFLYTYTILDVVVVFLLNGMFIAQFFCTLHAVAHRRRLANLFEKLRNVDRRLCREFACMRSSTAQQLSRQHERHTDCMVFVIFIAVFASTQWFYYWAIEYLIISCVLAITSVAIRVRCLQMMFYVRTLQRHLLLMNLVLEQQQNMLTTYDDESAEAFSTLGRIFNGIWKVADDLNRCFGASALPLTADVFLALAAIAFLSAAELYYETIFGLLPVIVSFALVCWSCDECEESVSLCC